MWVRIEHRTSAYSTMLTFGGCWRAEIRPYVKMKGVYRVTIKTGIETQGEVEKEGGKQRERERELDIVWTVYHLVIYMQSNKIHKVFQ